MARIKKTKPAAGGPAIRASAGEIDFDQVRELARIAVELDLVEVEADGAGRVRVRRADGHGPAHSIDPAMTSFGLGAIPLRQAASALKGAAPVDQGVVISSPFVGTFYRSPSPEAKSFVDVGQSIKKGQVVCIVEAMKLMNEIESESDGKVMEILAKNGDHVEYGQALLRLAPS